MMGCDDYGGMSHAAIVAESKQHRETSRQDPRGVQYMDQLWGLIMNEGYNSPVVLRTDDASFDDVPVRAWWSHGWYDFDTDRDSRKERSSLVFDIPDEVWRRLQSSYATRVKRELFGSETQVDLPEPFRRIRDDLRVGNVSYHGHEFVHEIIENDWKKLRRAIELCASDSSGHLGGQSIMLVGNHVGRARVVKSRLEIHIGNAVDEAIRDWQGAARGMLNAGEFSRRY